MRPAMRPLDDVGETRLMLLDPRAKRTAHRTVRALGDALRAGDVVVVNDAATLPGMLRGHTQHGAFVELRLDGDRDAEGWRAVTFGAGDWRVRTEDREAPPALHVGDEIAFEELTARVVWADGRRVRVKFSLEGAALWQALFRVGRPVQYAYLERALDPWDVQTVYAGRPWAAEMPSAGRPLTAGQLIDLRRAGVVLASVTHAAGLSSTGDDVLDRAMPWPERYEIPASTVRAVNDARARGGRVIAVGTSVVRALEGCVQSHGALRAGEGVTALRIDARLVRRVVDGLLTGMHDPGSSHFDLLGAFAHDDVLRAAHAEAEQRGYRAHEFGDSALILDGVLDDRAMTLHTAA